MQPYKYEYLLHCWGGFWNQNNIKIHGEPEINYKWFDTEEEREKEFHRLRALVKEHSKYLQEKGLFDDSCLVMSKSEGYLTRFQFIIKALVKVNDRVIEVENNLGYGFWSDDEIDKLGYFADYFKEYKYDICSDIPDDHELLFSTIILK